jgi:hypothetical protein
MDMADSSIGPQRRRRTNRLGILILAILGSCFALSLSPYTRNFLLRIHWFSDRQTNDVRRPNSLDKGDGNGDVVPSPGLDLVAEESSDEDDSRRISVPWGQLVLRRDGENWRVDAEAR